jgi:excisionase family DNA binding protein
MSESQAEPKTLDVPTAGRVYLGLPRGAAYAAAKAGTIPTIRIGRKLRVPVAAMKRLVGETT